MSGAGNQRNFLREIFEQGDKFEQLGEPGDVSHTGRETQVMDLYRKLDELNRRATESGDPEAAALVGLTIKNYWEALDGLKKEVDEIHSALQTRSGLDSIVETETAKGIGVRSHTASDVAEVAKAPAATSSTEGGALIPPVATTEQVQTPTTPEPAKPDSSKKVVPKTISDLVTPELERQYATKARFVRARIAQETGQEYRIPTKAIAGWHKHRTAREAGTIYFYSANSIKSPGGTFASRVVRGQGSKKPDPTTTESGRKKFRYSHTEGSSREMEIAPYDLLEVIADSAIRMTKDKVVYTFKQFGIKLKDTGKPKSEAMKILKVLEEEQCYPGGYVNPSERGTAISIDVGAAEATSPTPSQSTPLIATYKPSESATSEVAMKAQETVKSESAEAEPEKSEVPTELGKVAPTLVSSPESKKYELTDWIEGEEGALNLGVEQAPLEAFFNANRETDFRYSPRFRDLLVGDLLKVKLDKTKDKPGALRLIHAMLGDELDEETFEIAYLEARVKLANEIDLKKQSCLTLHHAREIFGDVKLFNKHFIDDAEVRFLLGPDLTDYAVERERLAKAICEFGQKAGLEYTKFEGILTRLGYPTGYYSGDHKNERDEPPTIDKAVPLIKMINHIVKRLPEENKDDVRTTLREGVEGDHRLRIQLGYDDNEGMILPKDRAVIIVGAASNGTYDQPNKIHKLIRDSVITQGRKFIRVYTSTAEA